MKNPADVDEATMKGQVIDRQLEVLDDSVPAIKGSVEAESADVHVLNNYVEKIKNLERKLEVIEKEIVYPSLTYRTTGNGFSHRTHSVRFKSTYMSHFPERKRKRLQAIGLECI